MITVFFLSVFPINDDIVEYINRISAIVVIFFS